MSDAATTFEDTAAPPPGSIWRELWTKEDWWAVWLGLGLVIVAYGLFLSGSSIAWLAVAPAKWSAWPQLLMHFQLNALRYLAQFAVLLALFSVGAALIGYPLGRFAAGFVLIYVLSVVVFAAAAWDRALYYNLEPPLIALAGGLIIGNLLPLPRALDAGFRVEFYIKTGIVLLGATLPFTLIVWAGPVAILQASVVSVATFLVIYAIAVKLGLDRRLAATLGAGGAVCGVSAAIAIGGAVRARREDPPIAITLVVLWAIVMIFVLPLASRALSLPAGVGGAWIGTSEFADAAGFAAAQTYGGFAASGAVPGSAEQAVAAYTLIKVVGRDVWIGIWAFVLSFIAVTRWETAGTGRRADGGEIWRRFPKFVVGFLLASLLVTLAVPNTAFADYNALVRPKLILPITTLRTWAFTFSFLSIGLTTRLREFAPSGGRPFLAFSGGVVVNVVLGFIFSVVLFGSYWQGLAH